ncbi:MAG: immunity 9 family protein, partial [Helicobacteraceae bacterium]|nr:immunity 9 family protein [Helicobacteraceae bacterium]
MDEKVRVLLPTEIPNLDEDVDITSIAQGLNDYVKALIAQINIQDLDEWNLLILVNARYTNGVGVFKRARRYPSDKEFEISISITIPNDDEAPYGLSKVKDGFYMPLND